MTTDITTIARRMSKVIPKPKKKLAKPALSWRQLKPQQYLTNTRGLRFDKRIVSAGTMWYVVAVTSTGAELQTISVNPMKYTWTVPSWKNYFARARKPSQSQLAELLIKSLKEKPK